MSCLHRRGRHWRAAPVRVVLALAAAAGLLVAMVATRGFGHAASAVRASSAPAAARAPAPSTTSRPQLRAAAANARPPAPAATSRTSLPVRLVVPAIGVDSALEPLHRLPSGSLQSPRAWQVAGWYADGVRPGDQGPAVIAGHVDSVSGPAVFYQLRDLHEGDSVYIRQQDRHVLRFIVDSLQIYPKNVFPTLAVYGPTPEADLRLITCTGEFDWVHHNYLDNLVVSAHLA
jgi:LPXTG-site transpeptidase (sortase) family protein